MQDVKEKGDFAYRWKEVANMDNQPKGFGGNVAIYTQLHLINGDLIKEFIRKQDLYIKHPKFFGILMELFKEGLAFTEGKVWKRHRKHASMAFHYDYLTMIIPDIIKIADEFLEKIKCKDLNKVNAKDEFEAITGELVGRIFFGEKFSEYNIDGRPLTIVLADILNRVGVETFNPLTSLFGSKLMRLGLFKRHRELTKDIKEFKAFCKKIVENKMKEFSKLKEDQKSLESKNLLWIFYEQRLKSPEDAFTDDEIIDEFITFFFAGMDTTGLLLTAMAYYTTLHPEYTERLMNEVNTHFADPSKVSVEDLNKMEFMTAFIKETLRVVTPAPMIFTRKAQQDHTLGNLKIKKGTLVTMNMLANNYNPKIHNEPTKFDPDRWLTDSQTMKSISNNPFLYTPFSTGGRNCIGQHLAMNEARIIFSLFLKKYKAELTDKNYKLEMIFRMLYEAVKDIEFALTTKI